MLQEPLEVASECNWIVAVWYRQSIAGDALVAACAPLKVSAVHFLALNAITKTQRTYAIVTTIGCIDFIAVVFT